VWSVLEAHPLIAAGYVRSDRGAHRTRNRYQDIIAEVENEADRINRRFQTRNGSHCPAGASPQPSMKIEPYYHARFCMVTSLARWNESGGKESFASRGARRR